MDRITTYKRFLELKESFPNTDVYGDSYIPYQWNSPFIFKMGYTTDTQLKNIQQKPTGKYNFMPKSINPYQMIEVEDIESGKTYTGRFLKGETMDNGDYISVVIIDDDERVRTVKPKTINTI